jgi:hypothetical protein
MTSQRAEDKYSSGGQERIFRIREGRLQDHAPTHIDLGVRYEFYGSPYIPTGFTSSTADIGVGLFGVGPHNQWRPLQQLAPAWKRLPWRVTVLESSSHAFELPERRNAGKSADLDLRSKSDDGPSSSLGRKRPTRGKTAVPWTATYWAGCRLRHGKFHGSAKGKTTVRGGYQISYGGSGRTVGGGGTTADETVIGLRSR